MTVDVEFIKGMLFLVGVPLLMSGVAESFLLILREGIGHDIRQLLDRAGARSGFSKRTH